MENTSPTVEESQPATVQGAMIKLCKESGFYDLKLNLIVLTQVGTLNIDKLKELENFLIKEARSYDSTGFIFDSPMDYRDHTKYYAENLLLIQGMIQVAQAAQKVHELDERRKQQR